MTSFTARSVFGCVLGLTISLVAADVVFVPNTFVANTPALAADVNANFTALQDNINGNLDDTNLKAGGVGSSSLAGSSITSVHLASDSVGSSEIASGAVGSSELSEFVTFGVAGTGGGVLCTNDAGSTKSWLGFSTDAGGYLEVRNEGNSGRAIILATPTTGDGGQISVLTSGGATAVQLQPDGDIFKIGNNGFIHPHPQDPSTQIVYMSLEGGERGTYCRGEARLVGGRAEIAPPGDWQLVTSEQGVTAQVTPAGPCNGIFVESVSPHRLVVVELNDGTSNAKFYYQLNGVRDGFEDHEVFEQNTMFLLERDLDSAQDLPAGIVKPLVSNGILAPDGRRNVGLVERLKAEALASVRASRHIPTTPAAAQEK